MRFVVQRVSRVSLEADGEMVDRMTKGLLVMVGIKSGDEKEEVRRYMLDKLVNLRIFEDENGKMNLSVKDVDGEIFLVSNFTLYGDCRHGRRPSYSRGASPEEAGGIYRQLVEQAGKEAGVKVHSGVFQAYMRIDTLLDGPVTLLIDSDKEF